MRRLVHTAVAAVACSLGLLVAAAGPAHAATGTLTVGFQIIQNPSGCYNSQLVPLIVVNETDQAATVYDQPDCQGNVIGEIPAGASSVFGFGASVSIP